MTLTDTFTCRSPLVAGSILASLAFVTFAPAAGASVVSDQAAPVGSTVSAYGAPAADQDAAAADSADLAALRGSIVYVKKNNIWLTRGDGTGTKQVTRDGNSGSPYRVPSQSDSGIIAAARGNLIVRMDRTGKILNTIDPPALVNSVGHSMDGAPTEVAISPDGKKIAWSFGVFECPVGSECGMRVATGYTESTKSTPVSKWGSTYYDSPSWVGNKRTLQTFGAQAEIHDLGSPSRHWFTDSDYAADGTDIADLELSDDGSLLAETRGFGDDITVLWFTVKGDATSGPPPAVPSPLCMTNESSGVASPTFAPGTAAIAYEFPDGIWVKADPKNCASPQPTLIVAGGHHPDWSPAAL